ncbi:hypothetical protein MtrunA17_Chr7g0234021 [Medicago truncatula]|uniref:Uncharacterized protein n=1 Tax=Medicago truncatula TaxID=3880 RepID=A0A396H3H8_MEDTR|nr:hypothetical protein MtrunA17_Chr7g0234021 [Medicago truncatula]
MLSSDQLILMVEQLMHRTTVKKWQRKDGREIIRLKREASKPKPSRFCHELD